MDWTLYWFMFPVSIGVATAAMLSGIGGAALFTPIFLIIFPMLGPEYPLATPVAAIGAALLTQVFGFWSGFVSYLHRGLIDFRGAVPFILVGVPTGIGGALLAHDVDQRWLKLTYALLMIALAVVLLMRHEPVARELSAQAGDFDEGRPLRSIVASDGLTYTYRAPRQGVPGAIGTGFGGFLTGMLSVGIGEVVMPQLVRRDRVPVPVAAATSVFVVISVVASASFAHVAAMIAGGGLASVPWNLVCWTVPAVVVGGQIGPRLQGRVPHATMERSIAIIFAVIGLSMAVIALREFGVLR